MNEVKLMKNVNIISPKSSREESRIKGVLPFK